VLQWNEFPITYSFRNIILKFNVLLTTRTLSLNQIPDNRIERHRLILDLHNRGLSDKEIASYLNQEGIKTPKGLDYYYQLIFVTRRKLRLREQRRNDSKWTISNVRLLLIEN